MKERRKELVMEGHRFYDEMRLGLTLNREKTQGEGTDHYLNSTDLISPN
ncbi:RagB/SusD family nutrient uptake outer membrane protein [Bacteroides cellulosilyticus]